LEFDIGFLLDCYFLIRGDARGITAATCAFPIGVSGNGKRRSASAATFPATAGWLAMAFGMPETDLSRRGILQEHRKHQQLDSLASGMPKILG
jgi:hypothetical protein